MILSWAVKTQSIKFLMTCVNQSTLWIRLNTVNAGEIHPHHLLPVHCSRMLHENWVSQQRRQCLSPNNYMKALSWMVRVPRVWSPTCERIPPIFLMSHRMKLEITSKINTARNICQKFLQSTRREHNLPRKPMRQFAQHLWCESQKPLKNTSQETNSAYIAWSGKDLLPRRWILQFIKHCLWK